MGLECYVLIHNLLRVVARKWLDEISVWKYMIAK